MGGKNSQNNNLSRDDRHGYVLSQSNEINNEENDSVENLEIFDFTYNNIIKYLCQNSVMEFRNQKIVIEKLEEFVVNDKFHLNSQKIKGKEHLMIISNPYPDKINSEKLFVKSMLFNYDNSKISSDDINKKYPKQYFQNKNILKEVRILRNHKNRYIIKCRGYIIDELNSAVHFLYDHYQLSIESIIKDKLVNLENKIKIFKNLLELIKFLHTNGIISLNLSVKSIFFTKDQYELKQVSFGNSFDMKSVYDIDRNSKLDKNNFDIHLSPEIILKETNKVNWHSDIWSLGIILLVLFSSSDSGNSDAKEGEKSYFDANEVIKSYTNKRIPETLLIMMDKINNIYIKAITIGLLRIDSNQRPNIFEIIDIFNQFINHMKFEDSFIVSYTKKDVLGKNFKIILDFFSIFQKSTHQLLKEELEKNS